MDGYNLKCELYFSLNCSYSDCMNQNEVGETRGMHGDKRNA